MTEAQQGFYIVGVGASAGGLESLQRFFSQVPPIVEIAFVVVQHLSPDYESHMVDLLAKQTTLCVSEAEDGTVVRPDHIYLIPRRKNMTIFNGRLFLVDYDRSLGLNLPIDIFFDSLAQEQGDKAIGVILSGTGSDGTHGSRAIKEVGGMVMAQDHTAKFDGMPRSVIATQLVDYVASPENLFGSLLNYAKNRDSFIELTNSFAPDETKLGRLFAILRTHTNIDFSDYKPNTILRRLDRRMSLHQLNDLEEYISYLGTSSQESHSLVKEFLIGVTRFFRDPEAFQLIAEEVIPAIFATKTAEQQVRIWTPGCATGEEAYSLAILFYEYMQQHNCFHDVKIFATDINASALEGASKGVYSAVSMADIPAERLQQFFTKKEDCYEIGRHVRSMVVFAQQNLIKDPPFAKIDLLVCRNLLIYLKSNLQQHILSLFHFALKNKGFLYLGSSESIGEFSDVFTPLSTKWKIYQCKGSGSPRLPAQYLLDNTEKQHLLEPPQSVAVIPDEQHDSMLHRLIEQAMPPCVVVDETRMILHAFGDVKSILEAPIGFRVSLDIQQMVPKALETPLRTALHRTFTKNEDVYYRNIRVERGENVEYIHLSTKIFEGHQAMQRFALVIFELVVDNTNQIDTEEFSLGENALLLISNLEKELQYTRENLQATIEELETSNEELQATNEELLASNEELQSTNEELQSVNEELITVNTEYQLKIRELTQLNDDINNLFDSTPVGTVFLDADLCIRKFTPAAQRVINLLHQDIGRPLNHISHNLVNIDLPTEARKVLSSREKITLEVHPDTKQWYLVEILPYITHARTVEGVVLILIDLSEQNRMRGQLINDQRKIYSMIEAGGLAFWELELKTGKVTFSARKAEVLGYVPQQFDHYTDFTALIHPDDYEKTMDAMRQHLEEKARRYDIEYRIQANDQSYHWFKDIGQVTQRDEEGSPLLVAGITNDITDLKAMVETITTIQEKNAMLQSQLERQ